MIEGVDAESLLDERVRRFDTHRLQNGYWSVYDAGRSNGPYPWQVRFHNLGLTCNERMLMCANRIGKCISIRTRVDVPGGFKTPDKLRAGDLVWSFDGSKRVISKIGQPFKKPAEPVYRLSFRDGSWFECASEHRVLCRDGHWRFVGHLLRCVFGRLPSSVEPCLSVPTSGVRNYWQTEQGFRCGYRFGFGLCGGQPHCAGVGGQSGFPSQADARRHSLVSCVANGSERRSFDSPSELPFLPSSMGAFLPILARFFGFSVPTFCIDSGSFYASTVVESPPASVSGSFVRSLSGAFHDRCSAASCVQTPDGSYNPIVSCEWVGVEPVWDFSVEGTHNYIAGGAVHHNTYTCGAEVVIHATGLYPPWWEGRRFARNIECLVSGESNESTRDICQKQLLGMVDSDRAPDGTGWVPGECIGPVTYRQCGVPNVLDTCKVRHVCGKYSVIKFRSFEQGASKFQGVPWHLAWLDEEPDDSGGQAGIFPEVQTRLMDHDGLLLFSRTPLYGRTRIVSYFMDSKSPRVGYVMASLSDAPHITPEKAAEWMAKWPEHERETRATGVPMLGYGAVFPIVDGAITIDPIPIPGHWRRICGIDFGLNDDGAAVWIAYDEDSDIVYIYDCYKERNWTSGLHSIAIRKRGEWIPIAWPHDGLSREKSSGAVLIEQYDLPSRLGLSARYADDKGGGQDKGPWVNDMLQRMQTGRVKVFRTLTRWFEEKRMYHRDGEPPKIVDGNDHLLDATRYAMIMLRYAVSETQGTGGRHPQSVYDHNPLDRFLSRST